MADTVLTELKIHEFDSVEQMSQHESEIGENDLAFTPDMTAETLNGKADVGFGNVSDTAKELMANSSMPSGTYIDLTLGATGNTYIAPADGWFHLSKTLSGSNQYVIISANGVATRSYGAASGSYAQTMLPVKRGAVVKVSYNAGGSTNAFQFIYAEGAKYLAS